MLQACAAQCLTRIAADRVLPVADLTDAILPLVLKNLTGKDRNEEVGVACSPSCAAAAHRHTLCLLAQMCCCICMCPASVLA
jgi:hypothetical protein